MPQKSAEEELYFACEQVLACARQGNGVRPADKDEIVISYDVFRMVVAALKKADERKSLEEDASYRAALVSIGFMHEDHTGPLRPEWIESAKRIIAERERLLAT